MPRLLWQQIYWQGIDRVSCTFCLRSSAGEYEIAETLDQSLVKGRLWSSWKKKWDLFYFLKYPLPYYRGVLYSSASCMVGNMVCKSTGKALCFVSYLFLCKKCWINEFGLNGHQGHCLEGQEPSISKIVLSVCFNNPHNIFNTDAKFSILIVSRLCGIKSITIYVF